MKVILCAALTVVLLSLSGCATTWTYDKKNYGSSTEALEAARQDIRQKVSAVTERQVPLAGSVLILTPTVAWSRQAVLTKGQPSDEIIRYVASTLYYGFYGMAEAIQRRKIFSSTNTQEFAQRDPLGNASYDYLLWLRLDGPDSAQWMIAPGSDTSMAKPVFTSPISDPGDRVSNFVRSVEENLASVTK